MRSTGSSSEPCCAACRLDRLVLLSTHLTEDIELLADRVLVLSEGRVAFDGAPARLAELGAAGAEAGDTADARLPPRRAWPAFRDGRAMTRLALRRSAGRLAAPVMLAVVAAHVLLRGRTWTHEWLWAVYQFGFVVILLGPLVAGIAAWEGWRLSTAGDLLATSLRPRQAAVQTWLATVAWGVLVYLVGLGTVVVLVLAAGAPGWPDLRVLGAALPPLALLAAEAAVGMLAGWWLRHALAAPAAALGCFGLSLWCYASGPSQFITVGGATSSLVGLAPRPGVELAQLLFFAAAALAAVLMAARPRPSSRGADDRG